MKLDLKSASDDELKKRHDLLQEKINALHSKQFKIQDEQARRKKELEDDWQF